jgi:putative membrane protein
MAAFPLHELVPALEPWLTALLLASALGYAAGVRRLWKEAGMGRGITRSDAARFASGWLMLVLALASPLDRWADRSFGIHMVQHELLMVVAAPLLVLARPLEAWSWALPVAVTRAIASWNRGLIASWMWRAVTEPVGAWCVHALALWAWHWPAAFAAATANEGVHVLQHASFFVTALCFWWSVFGRRGRPAGASAMASLLTTMLHTGALGALLTLAPSTWYPTHAPSPLGLSPLEEQQLGGLVMWLPGSLAYLAAGLWVAWTWLREAPPRPRTADSRAAS